MMKRPFAYLLFMAMAMPYYAMAWGSTGHRIIAKIAYNQLRPAVKDSVNKYLGLVHIEDAGTWMDDVRGDAAYDYMSTWHYVNIAKDSLRSPEDYKSYVVRMNKHISDVHNVPDSLANVIWAINNAIYELYHRNRYNRERITTDIKMLFHLIGDLHQPLHVGYPEDKGGNTVSVFYRNSPTSLHKVWDTEIIESEVMGHPTTWADLSKYKPDELAEIRRIDLAGWLADSRSKLGSVYDFKGEDIDKKYVERNLPIIEEQLLKAGLRLGSLLNEIFTQPIEK